MKIVENDKKPKQKNKKKNVIKPKKDHVLIVAQEIKFARLLSGNEKKTRDRVLKTLKKWLLNCFQKEYEFKEDDFIRIWKGLFYAVWMSDKPLIQEDLCESISGILDQFPSEQFRHSLMMVKAGFKVLAIEWYGIDHHRMDKYLMLVRRYLRGSLRCLQRSTWDLNSCQMYTKMLTDADGVLCTKTPHYARNALSMVLHIVECFLEELSKVSEGDIPEESLVELLRPFCAYMSGGEVPTLYVACRKLLTGLVRQSELGLRYGDATSAWKKMGCPKGGPEALELVSDDEENDDDEQNSDDLDLNDDEQLGPKPLDPRAGRVHVTLQPLPVPALQLASMLKGLLTKASSKAHKRVKICMERFEKLSRSEYPLPVPQSDIERSTGPRISTEKSLKSLRALEKNIVETSDELALRGLNRKHRKRLLAKSRTGSSIIEDVQRVKNKTTDTTNGDWQVETTEPKSKKAKNEFDKENVNSKNKQDKKAQKRKLAAIAKGDIVKKKKVDKIEKVNFEKEAKAKIISEKTIKKNKVKNVVKVNGVANKNTEAIEVKNREIDTNNKKISKVVNDGESKSTKKLLVKEKRESKSNTVKNGVADESKNTPKITIKEKIKETDDKLKKHENKTLNAGNKETESNEISKIKNINVKNLEKILKDVPKSKKLGEKPMKLQKSDSKPAFLVNKVKKFPKISKMENSEKISMAQKKVKFVLKNNSMQKPVDYYKSVRQSPNIPFDSSKRPSKTNLKPSTPSPINPFFKKKLRMN